ncbi:uncharacterized protein LOC141613460 [Silene latifolia]|uniref:uncharacterized protein LOC141613460 n=1 Tax=Silene latifolia TaxID=37657 RepID=UPI003D76F59A
MGERIGPNPPSVSEILAFNKCLLDCTLKDINSFGCEHTWTKKRESNDRVWSRLDRVLTNPSWLVHYPSTHVQILPAGISDHSSLFVDIHETYVIRRNFSYINCWEKHKGYRSTVQKAWDIPVKGNQMFKLFAKLKNVRKHLIDLHRPSYSGLSKRVSDARKCLQECQMKLQQQSLDLHLIEQEKILLHNYFTFRKTERSSLQQRAKIKDVKFNDAHTSYFFSIIAAWKHQSFIGRIQDIHGTNREGLSEGQTVQEHDWGSLCREVTAGEIRKALFSMRSHKSPGQDGFSAQYFRTIWDIIKSDFCSAIQEFVMKGTMPKQANTTLLLEYLSSTIV